MAREGDPAPDFTAPLATGEDIDEFELSDAITGGPVVLAFFPGAFTSVCSSEMRTFRDRISNIAEAGGQLYGVSVDSPFALNEFHHQNDLNFPLISDANREVVEQYDVSMDFESIGVHDVAQRAVFVVDESGTITYDWVSEGPAVEPDYQAVETAVETVA